MSEVPSMAVHNKQNLTKGLNPRVNLNGEEFEERITCSVQSNHIPTGTFNTEWIIIQSISPYFKNSKWVEEAKQFFTGCCPCLSEMLCCTLEGGLNNKKS